MNRRNFFRNLGAATVGVIVAPVVVAQIIKTEPEPKFNVFHSGGYTFYLKQMPQIPRPSPPGWATKFQWVYSTPGNISFYNKAL